MGNAKTLRQKELFWMQLSKDEVTDRGRAGEDNMEDAGHWRGL